MARLTRRGVLATGSAAAALAVSGCAGRPGASHPSPFVKRHGQSFFLEGEPYHYAGANIWYGAWLGAEAPYGNRDRLKRELDTLAGLGVRNLRILASAEEGPLKAGIKPGFRTKDSYNEALFEGLDYCMAELAKRDMKSVLYLTNFWEWSGGMMTYLYYVTGAFTDMNDPAHPWPEFPDHVSEIYASGDALALYHAHVGKLVGRTNTITGTAYADDPAIMSWQLCNEPRPGVSPEVMEAALPAYYDWIDTTARLIRALDPNHLVSLGQEGTAASNGREDVFIRAHQDIDYATAHIWPQNWGWVDGKDLAGTWDAGAEKVADYIAAHVRMAEAMDKPLVFEEFGFPRDGEAYDRASGTSFRQRFYGMIYEAVEQSMARGGPVAGSNFWAWNGEARVAHADFRFRPGDTAYMGDPPHEPQGWYGIFDTDAEMHALIRAHAEAIGAA
ncbi:MAG: cellulase family glycosylhydrolase [Henriciella sp.]